MIDTTHTLSPDWLNENELRAYPLADDAPAAAVLQSWLIADLRLTVDAAYGTIFISSAYVSETLVSIGISAVTTGGTTVGLLTRTVTRDELEPGRAYALDRMTGHAAGSITFGTIPPDAEPFKVSFTASEAPLVTGVLIRLKAPGVTCLVDREHNVTADGIIDLSGNSEFRTAVDPNDPQTIVITLADIYRELSTSVCSLLPSFSSCGQTPVKTINGVSPDPTTGRITLKFR